MALYSYFSTKADTLLSDPWGPLAKQVPSTTITSANEEARFAARDIAISACLHVHCRDLVWELTIWCRSYELVWLTALIQEKYFCEILRLPNPH